MKIVYLQVLELAGLLGVLLEIVEVVAEVEGLFCFVLFDLQLSVCLCWHLGTAAGTIPTRK